MRTVPSIRSWTTLDVYSASIHVSRRRSPGGHVARLPRTDNPARLIRRQPQRRFESDGTQDGRKTSRLSDTLFDDSEQSSPCFQPSVSCLIGPVNGDAEDLETDEIGGVDGSLRVPVREIRCQQQREASIAEEDALVVPRPCPCLGPYQPEPQPGIPPYDPYNIVFGFDMNVKQDSLREEAEGLRLTLGQEVERTLKLVDAWITWVIIHAHEWQE
jgi:hypothetical protein